MTLAKKHQNMKNMLKEVTTEIPLFPAMPVDW